jgi:hypothetical protein
VCASPSSLGSACRAPVSNSVFGVREISPTAWDATLQRVPDPDVNGVSPLYIERLAVEEGFLDGLELSFQPGLNVLIGPRGVGKTSVVELLRFCIDAPAMTDRFARASRDHALSVLGKGRVTVTYAIDGDRFTISRRAFDEHPEGESMPTGRWPIILAQNEIESVGLDARGRLRLIDGFRGDGTEDLRKERAALSNIDSISKEVQELADEIALLEDQTSELPTARAALAAAEHELATQQQTLEREMPDLSALDRLSEDLASEGVQRAMLERAIAALSTWSDMIAEVLRTAPSIEDPPHPSVSLALVRDRVQAAQRHLDSAGDDVEEAAESLQLELAEIRKRVGAKEDRARELRRLADSLQAGAGAVARRRAALREQVAQLEALANLLEERRTRLQVRRSLRDTAIQELENVRLARFQARQQVAQVLTHALRPQIEIDVRRSGLAGDYAQTIAEALRGSGLHYSQIAPLIAERIPPYELVRAAEEGDPELIASVIGIPLDRAARVLERLRTTDMSPILRSSVEDAASLRLLVGAEYRDTTHLSTGQRCTTILPILLHHENRPLAMDQPEDHLDTAFIVETLVRAIRQRSRASQLVVTTHNPNIPVLGEASQVTVLGSDGRRGYETHSGSLDDPLIVEAITTIMEGGREAFELRARFYRAHPG